jgi:antitoxin component YwqK of YwqJK toxin-antitoxin module
MKILFILLLISSTVLGQNQKDSKGRKQGEWVKYHENSNVPLYKGQFIDDKPTGKFVYYYPSSKVMAVVNHDHKTGRSESFMYHENKKLMAHGIYINQKKDSVWTHYGPSERLSFKETYKNDVLNGKKTIYYVPEDPYDKRVEIAQEMTFVNGRLNGEAKDYFPGGAIKKECVYHEGVYNGVVKHYHPTGGVMLIERWKDRKKHGWWMTYNNQGKEIGRTYYHNGRVLEGDLLKRHLARLKKEGMNPNE